LQSGACQRREPSSFGQYTKVNPWQRAIKVFVGINVYLLIFLSASLVVLAISYFGPRITRTPYFEHSHLFWICVGLSIVFYSIYRRLVEFDWLKWEALSDIRAIPSVSPAFCFGMPVLFKSNIAPIKIDNASFNWYIALSFASGLLFLIYLVYFAINNHAINAGRQSRSQVTGTGFILMGAAMFLLLLATFDLIVLIGFEELLSVPWRQPYTEGQRKYSLCKKARAC
jgi:hypothetical protein